MNQITIPISDEGLAQVESLAAQAGLTSTEYLRQCVDELLVHEDAEFAAIADHIMQKNAELYRRLA